MAEHVSHAGDEQNPTVHHELTDIDLRGVLGFAIGLVAVAVVVHILIWVMFRFFDAREARQDRAEYPLAVQQGDRLPPEPRLQTDPRQDLQDLRTQEDEALTSYGWVDKNNGVVRIPVEEAMKIVVQRGLPARQGSR